jgi:hypothetical protein
MSPIIPLQPFDRARQDKAFPTYQRIDPPEPIEVLRLGTWWPGSRSAWVMSQGQPYGLCRWREGFGRYHVSLVRQHKMRIPA